MLIIFSDVSGLAYPKRRDRFLKSLLYLAHHVYILVGDENKIFQVPEKQDDLQWLLPQQTSSRLLTYVGETKWCICWSKKPQCRRAIGHVSSSHKTADTCCMMCSSLRYSFAIPSLSLSLNNKCNSCGFLTYMPRTAGLSSELLFGAGWWVQFQWGLAGASSWAQTLPKTWI